MDDLVPKEPDEQSTSGAPSAGSSGQDGQGSRRQRTGQVFDETDCMRGLSQLPGLVVMKMIKPGESNAMRSAYEAILHHHHHAQSSGATAPVIDANMIAQLRDHPELLRLLEPFLTEDQLQTILKGSDDE